MTEILNDYDMMETVTVESNEKTDIPIELEISTTQLGKDKKLQEDFIWAIKSGLSDEVKKLIQSGANVNQNITYMHHYYEWSEWCTCTALEYAAEHGHANIVKQLIQAGADIYENALIMAAANGYAEANDHADVIKELVQVINVNYTNHRGETALMHAAKEFHLSSVEELIQAGSNLNCKNKFGETAIMIAIKHDPKTTDVLSYLDNWKLRYMVIHTLLNAKADVSLADRDGNTALILAVKNHDSSTVSKLLAPHRNPWLGGCEKKWINDAEWINHADKNGNTAVMHAIKSLHYTYTNNREYQRCMGSQSIVESLLNDPRINLYHVNKEGDNAITLLNEEGNKRISCYLKS